MKFVNVGFGNLVSLAHLLAVVRPDAAPIKRIVQRAKEEGRLIDATHGRRARAVLMTDSDHCILSYLPPETVEQRMRAPAPAGPFAEEGENA